MTVGELVQALLRLPQQSPVCLPPEAADPGYPQDFNDPHEITGTSRWDGDYIDRTGRALIRGPYIQLECEEG